MQDDLKTGATRLAWERPVLRRLDASDAQFNDNMKADENLNGGPHDGGAKGGGGSNS